MTCDVCVLLVVMAEGTSSYQHNLLPPHELFILVMFHMRTHTHTDDTEETLQVFDAKLRHMRQDIGAIEQCNNTLELTARNNTRLLDILKVRREAQEQCQCAYSAH